MADALELALYAVLLAVAAAAVWRRPLVALYLFIVGLALHNAVMAALYSWGIRGSTLTAIAAWKEILLAVALLHVCVIAFRERQLPFRFGVADLLALAFAVIVVVYALVPQSALGGEAGHKAVALGFRHDFDDAAVARREPIAAAQDLAARQHEPCVLAAVGLGAQPAFLQAFARPSTTERRISRSSFPDAM